MVETRSLIHDFMFMKNLTDQGHATRSQNQQESLFEGMKPWTFFVEKIPCLFSFKKSNARSNQLGSAHVCAWDPDILVLLRRQRITADSPRSGHRVSSRHLPCFSQTSFPELKGNGREDQTTWLKDSKAASETEISSLGG